MKTLNNMVLSLASENLGMAKKYQLAVEQIDDFFLMYEDLRVKVRNLQESKIVCSKEEQKNSGISLVPEVEEKIPSLHVNLKECLEYKTTIEELKSNKTSFFIN
jgi:hypothetical protein